MASPAAHITKAKHNIKTIALLSQDLTQKDWIVTVAFYTALHIVDTVLFHTQEGYRKHGQSHDNREEIIKKNNSFKKIWEYYRPLSSISIIARYLQGSTTPKEVTVDFDQIMPDKELIAFIKEKLGGLINSAYILKPEEFSKYQLKEAFQTGLKDFLGLSTE